MVPAGGNLKKFRGTKNNAAPYKLDGMAERYVKQTYSKASMEGYFS